MLCRAGLEAANLNSASLRGTTLKVQPSSELP